MKSNKRFILKIQASIVSKNGRDDDRQKILVYNQDRSVQWQGDIDDDTIEALRGRKKAYFWATADPGGYIKISEEAPAQNW